MPIPSPEISDPMAVRQALLEAGRAHASGQLGAALAGVRRAAGICADAGHDRRAVALFDAAAELANRLPRSPAVAATAHAPGNRPPPMSPGAGRDPPPRPPAVGPSHGGEAVKSTAVTARTRLRRAMLAIDPSYAERVDYDASKPAGSDALEVLMRLASATSPDIGYVSEPADEDEGVRRDWALARPAPGEVAGRDDWPSDAAPAAPPSADHALAPPAGVDLAPALPVFPAHLVPIEDEGEVSVVFVEAGTEPPDSIATVLLVPASAQDAALLAAMYRDLGPGR